MKAWYESKMTWLGIITTLIGALQLVAEFLKSGAFSPDAVVLLVVGILGVILRVWFTDTAIAK
jgi:hypothetical protein